MTPFSFSTPLPLRRLRALAVLAAGLLNAAAWAAPEGAVWSAVQGQKQPLLDTLRDLVGMSRAAATAKAWTASRS